MHQEWQQEEKWQGKPWLEGFEERDLEKYEDLKQGLYRQFVARQLLEKTEGELKSLALEILKSEVGQRLNRITWWLKRWQAELTKKGIFQPDPKITKYIRIPIKRFNKFIVDFVKNPEKMLKTEIFTKK